MTMRDEAIDDWLSALAARQPTPGGGAVAALCAATSAALLGMVTIYTTGPRWADRENHMLVLHGELARIRADALSAADDDVAAFATVSAAYQLPKETPEQKQIRTNEIQKALLAAAEPPAHAGQLTTRLVAIAEELAESGNTNVLSDVAVGASTARAALESAIVNIEINRRSITADTEVARLDGIINQLGPAISAAEQVIMTVRERLAA